ncbi:MAG TPA: phosphotransferase [Thermomicrobiales bacterium]
MLDDPGLDAGMIPACLAANYGIRISSIAFLPLGHDAYAAVYRVVAGDDTTYFLKIRFAPPFKPGLAVPRALIDAGVPNILAPLRTLTSELWCPLEDDDGHSVVLYPFIYDQDAKIVGLSDSQWQEFGSTLRAVHASGLGDRFRGQLRVEDFALPSAALVRQIQTMVDAGEFESGAASGLAAFWRANTARIHGLLARAEELGRSLQSKSFELVLYHSDIHTANILVGDDGRIWLIDWDSPLVAPRERDLLFVIGSRIARPVEPRQEDLFFDGYGPTEIDPTALAFYRDERIVEDLGEFGKSVFLNPRLSEEARAIEADLAIGLFVPGGDIDRAETVPRVRWPGESR